MTMKPKVTAKPAPGAILADAPDDVKGQLKTIGGSMSDPWNNAVANQAISSAWLHGKAGAERSQAQHGVVQALVGIGPKDEIEGMLAAQLVASHNAAMECYRRAMIHDQGFSGWRECLTQAGKLSRTYATLVEALNRHRGKGQQKVTVEHVHVHPGGQAVVGNVTGGRGVPAGIEPTP